MSKWIALALAMLTGLLWAAASAPVSATPGEIHVVKVAVANLRAGPGTGTKVIERLRRGHRVMEFERRGDWLRVQRMGTVGREGWLHGALVGPEPAPDQPAPAPPPAAQGVPTGETPHFHSHRVILRSAPGRKAKRVKRLRRGGKFKRFKRRGRWVHKRHLSPRPQRQRPAPPRQFPHPPPRSAPG